MREILSTRGSTERLLRAGVVQIEGTTAVVYRRRGLGLIVAILTLVLGACSGGLTDVKSSATSPSFDGSIPNCEDFGEYHKPPGWTTDQATRMCHALNAVEWECENIGRGLWEKFGDGSLQAALKSDFRDSTAAGGYSKTFDIIRINVEHWAFFDPFQLRTTNKHEWGEKVYWDDPVEHDQLEQWSLSDSCGAPTTSNE